MTNILGTPVWSNDTDATTLGAYLAELLTTLLREGEGFDPKRPFGNSDWQGVIDEATDGPSSNADNRLADAIRDALVGSDAKTTSTAFIAAYDKRERQYSVLIRDSRTGVYVEHSTGYISLDEAQRVANLLNGAAQ